LFATWQNVPGPFPRETAAEGHRAAALLPKLPDEGHKPPSGSLCHVANAREGKLDFIPREVHLTHNPGAAAA